ncbi:MAG: hypothetical protein R3B47_11890 [Bacteroidia bacterium]
MQYRHPHAKKTVALVGKGVTFDTGGISIKGSTNMHPMEGPIWVMQQQCWERWRPQQNSNYRSI